MTAPSTIKARLRDTGFRLAAIAVAIGVWYVLTARAHSLFFPTPDKVLSAVWDNWIRPFSTTWSENLRPSLTRLLAGYLIAAALAITAGVTIGRSRRLGDYVEPVIDFVRAIPPPALLPLFLVVLGIGDSMKVALIATGVFPPILLNSIDGVRSIDPLYLETARVFRISRLRRVTHVILPSAAPKIFAGLRISMSIAVILMVISELVAATNGVGFRILQSQRQFRMVDLWAGLVVLGVIGAVLNAGLTVIERRVFRWERK
jgi:ABC-type nitrate/sulfonate/bicarbonate transport system permease component